ncbi:hypothetical protein GW916_14320 [bacterium]|nr:hypothetical protein [bacterium]
MKKTHKKYIGWSTFVLVTGVLSGGASVGVSAKEIIESPANVFSRSIMPSCQFVYSVESDIKVIAGNAGSLGNVLYLAWDNAWTDEVEFENPLYLEVDQGEESSEQMTWQISIQSMSTSETFLRRKMFLQWGEWDENGDFEPLSESYWSDIGRQFGEACQTSRNPDARFHQRELNLL